MSFNLGSVGPTIPSNFTITDSKPVSARIAPENKIDELNRSPNAKKLYNAGLIGGSVGTVLAAGLSAFGLIRSRKMIPQVKELGAGLNALAGAAATAILALPLGFAGSILAKTGTVFFSTRGKDKTEKV